MAELARSGTSVAGELPARIGALAVPQLVGLTRIGYSWIAPQRARRGARGQRPRSAEPEPVDVLGRAVVGRGLAVAERSTLTDGGGLLGVEEGATANGGADADGNVDADGKTDTDGKTDPDGYGGYG